jgi:hypothetical protein
MGNSSCTSLDKLSSACQLAGCIENVKGLKSNSSSSTDTWILTFKEGTKYEAKKVKTAFLKFWIAGSTINRIHEMKNDFDVSPLKALIRSTRSLNYELLFYREIIRPLIDFSICPHFIRYLGSGNNCKGADLVKILTKSGVPEKDAIARFARNFEFLCSYEKESPRPSITDPGGEEPSENIKAFVSCSEFNLLINENITENDQTLRQFMARIRNIKSLWRILFQIFAACYAASLTKSVHNDLHFENVWIRTDSPERIIHYNYNNHDYLMVTGNFVRLYDFDRAYSKQIGDNPFLTGDMTSQYSQSNEFIPNRDAVKVCSYVYTTLPNLEYREDLISAISPIKSYARGVLTQSFFTRIPGTEQSMTPDDFKKNFFSMEDMLHNMGKLAGIASVDGKRLNEKLQSLRNNKVHIQYYVCNKNMFDENGRFLQGYSVDRMYSTMVKNVRTRAEQMLNKEILKNNELRKQLRHQKNVIGELKKEILELKEKVLYKENKLVKASMVVRNKKRRRI